MKTAHSTRKTLLDSDWLHLSNEKSKLSHYFFQYTVLFIIVCFLVFCWYFLTGRTLINITDGWDQHYKALVYYAKYMRSIIRELLFNHRFVFPEWEFSFGEGNDVLQSMHYYVVGDPFAIFSVFVPTRFIWIYYNFMILFRMYLSGIAFSYLCFYTKKDISKYAVMAGTLSYVFCYWAILNANRHPYFLNPMLYFPLIILGIEKILRNEKPYVFIITVFVAAISNFYYFYVIVLMTVVYVAVRLIVKYKTDLRSMIKMLLRIAGSAILGAIMGGIILLPVAFDFLNDARMTSGNEWHLFYPLIYYSKLLGAFLSGEGDYWLCLGFTAPVILSVFLLFMQKNKNKLLKVCFFVCIVFILIPAFGQFFNGMSYMSNKWSWAFALLCSYIFVVMWPELMNLKLKTAIKLLCCLVIYFFALLFLEYSRSVAAFSCICIAFIFLFVILPFSIENFQVEKLWSRRKQFIALVLVVIGVANVSFFKNASSTGDYANLGKETKGVVKQLIDTDANAVKKIADRKGVDAFYRYSGRSLTPNASSMPGLSSTQYYWSLSNPYVSENMREIELRETLPQSHVGYDDRTSLLTLSSTRYYVLRNDDDAPLPYGFTYVDSIDYADSINREESIYRIYRNKNALPLAYTYNKVISEAAWEKLSAIEKQEAMLQSVMLNEYDGETQDNEVKYSSVPLDYTVNCNSSDVSLQDYGFVVTKENSSVTLNFEGLPKSETYFTIHGLDFDAASTYDLYFGDEKYDPLDQYTKKSWNHLPYAEREEAEKNEIFREGPYKADLTLRASSGVSKMINYCTKDYSWYNDRHDFTINLDYQKKPTTSVTITFSQAGIYSFDSIDIVCQPMDRYKKQVSALKKAVLENVDIGTDTIKGNISLKKPKILCFSVPYSIGWTAYVDGKETKLYQANIKNMALPLDKGNHDIKLVYHTPYLREGALISVIGFAGFGVLLIVQIYKRRKRRYNIYTEVEK